MDSNIGKAYVEIIEIIKHLSKTEYKKIPKEIVQKFETEKSKEYKSNLRFDIPLDKQDLLYETKIILSILYKKYLVNESERKIIEEKDARYFSNF